MIMLNIWSFDAMVCRAFAIACRNVGGFNIPPRLALRSMSAFVILFYNHTEYIVCMIVNMRFSLPVYDISAMYFDTYEIGAAKTAVKVTMTAPYGWHSLTQHQFIKRFMKFPHFGSCNVTFSLNFYVFSKSIPLISWTWFWFDCRSKFGER